jgi:hypothetical protein
MMRKNLISSGVLECARILEKVEQRRERITFSVMMIDVKVLLLLLLLLLLLVVVVVYTPLRKREDTGN